MASLVIAPGELRSTRRFSSKKIILVSAGVILTAAFLLAAYRYVVSPALTIREWSVLTRGNVTREEILSLLAPAGNETFFELDPERVRKIVLSHPRVQDAFVSRKFPDSIAIRLTERTAVAASFAAWDGRTVPVLIDAEGVVFAVNECPAEKLPLISGIKFENLKEGMHLPALILSLLSDIAEIRKRDKALLSLVSEIRIVNRGGGDFELLIYPEKFGVPVRSSRRLTAETLAAMTLVFDVLARDGRAEAVSELDFRTGTVVYREKETSVE